MRLWQSGVNMQRNAKVEQIDDRGVKATIEEQEQFFEADTVALTKPMETNEQLAKELEGKGYKVYRVGDCAATGGRIMEAMASGFRAGYEV